MKAVGVALLLTGAALAAYELGKGKPAAHVTPTATDGDQPGDQQPWSTSNLPVTELDWEILRSLDPTLFLQLYESQLPNTVSPELYQEYIAMKAEATGQTELDTQLQLFPLLAPNGFNLNLNNTGWGIDDWNFSNPFTSLF